MLQALRVLAALVVLLPSARADEICYDLQVCEEVCTEGYEVAPVGDTSLNYARRSGGFQQIELPVTCETVCTFEEYCYPTGGGEGTYDQDDIDACYNEQLLVDQIRCIQMLQS